MFTENEEFKVVNFLILLLKNYINRIVDDESLVK